MVSDAADELKDLPRLLETEFGDILKAYGESEGVEQFKRHHPAVLMLAFQNVEKAERFYLSLYRYVPEIHQIPHQTLLLTKGSESDKAYELCRSGSFDDYIADRPLHDPVRLRLSVTQALNRHNREQYLYLLNRRIDNIVVALREFDQIILQMLESGKGENLSTIRTIQFFAQTLAIDLEHLEENLSSQFDHDRWDNLQRESRRMAEELNKTGGWPEHLDDTHVRTDVTRKDSLVNSPVEIMLVDDDDFYRDTLVDMLEDAGMHVQAVADGKAAIDNLRQARPQLILLDYNMPGIDGIETLKRIKSNPAVKSIPVIMLTGVSSRDVVGQSIGAGASGYIVKPGEREKILSKIDEVLKKTEHA